MIGITDNSSHVYSCLKVVLIRSRHDNLVDLEHHSAQLCGQLKLLLLADQGINNESILHVIVSTSHAVDTQFSTSFTPGLDLLTLDLGKSSDRVETAVLSESHGYGVESLGEGTHGILLEAGGLDGSILDRHRAGNLGGTTTVDDSVVTDEISDDAESIV